MWKSRIGYASGSQLISATLASSGCGKNGNPIHVPLLILAKIIRIPDLELSSSHPKRAFIRRLVDLEVRLAYHDRIKETLPEAMLTEGSDVISPDPPEPSWPYEKDGQFSSSGHAIQRN
jgi:hypothetical protein